MQCFVSSSTLLSVLDGAHILLRNPNSPLGYGVLSYAQGFYLTVSSRVNWVLSFISATLSRVERYPSYPAFEDWALPVISSVRGLRATRQITRSRVDSNPSNHAFNGWEQPVKSRVRRLSATRYIPQKLCKGTLENTNTYFHSREREYWHDWSFILNMLISDSKTLPLD